MAVGAPLGQEERHTHARAVARESPRFAEVARANDGDVQAVARSAAPKPRRCTSSLPEGGIGIVNATDEMAADGDEGLAASTGG
jgi:hypothetical protein